MSALIQGGDDLVIRRVVVAAKALVPFFTGFGFCFIYARCEKHESFLTLLILQYLHLMDQISQ
jgi:hypothetical protein